MYDKYMAFTPSSLVFVGLAVAHELLFTRIIILIILFQLVAYMEICAEGVL